MGRRYWWRISGMWAWEEHTRRDWPRSECWEPNTWNERVLEMVKSHKISWIQESFNIFPVVWIRHSWRMANACSCYQIQTYQKSLYDRTLEGNTGTFLQIAWFCVLFFDLKVRKLQARPKDINVNDKSQNFTCYEVLWLSRGNKKKIIIIIYKTRFVPFRVDQF